MQCNNCGALMQDENNYCGNCGKPLEGARILFKDLVSAGMLMPGDKISCSHKSGTRVAAVVQAGGTLEVNGTICANPPEAMGAARGVACDSWHCWTYFDKEANREKPIHSLKREFRRRKSAEAK